MVRSSATGSSCKVSFPHTRGDGPPLQNLLLHLGLFSPHAWGWSALVGTVVVSLFVFPTRVGMVRHRAESGHGAERFPHTRGDGPQGCARRAQDGLFSPHAWGWSDCRPSPPGRCSVFPTRVGMVRCNKCGDPPATGFPHTRGDGPVLTGIRETHYVFSPHAWGWSATMW